MSTPVGSSQWMYSTASSFYPYLIDQSLRFNDNDSAKLTRTPASAGNRQTWTWSGWLKRSNLGTKQTFFCSTAGDYNLHFATDNKLKFEGAYGTTATDAVFRDVSSFYHILAIHDTTEVTSSDRFKIYVNGVQQTTSGSYPSGNGVINNTVQHGIGGQASVNFFDGYLAEINFIDGTALDPTSFGETINGIWVPKAYDTADGAYGTNGFYLSFADSAAIGDDLSGNTNDWTANNLAASDVVNDSPTNNWCTFNPLDQNDASGLTYPTTYSEGNLKLAQGTGFINRKATFGMTGGKWYWEIKINDSSPDSFFGVSKSTGDARGALDNDEATIRLTNGDLYTNGATSSYGTAFSNGDVCILAVDMDAGKFWAGRNGTWFASGDPAAGTNEGKSGLASELFPSVSLADAENCDVNFGQNGTFNGTKTAGGNSDGNGYGDFLYTVPSGFLALCSANLAEVTIGPNSTTTSDQHFNTVLYTGNASTNAITGVGFQPDFLWVKRRNSTAHHNLIDSVRGVKKHLSSSATNAEDTEGASNGLASFDADGFTWAGVNTGTGAVNSNGDSFVAWNWKAGGTAVSNTDGSITSSVSANPDAGFSIVSYTGTGANATVGHGLSSAPDLVIVKNRSIVSSWLVRHSSLTASQTLLLENTTSVIATNYWQSTQPDSSVFYVSSNSEANGSTNNLIAYCFANTEGHLKCASYVGNGSTDGTFVFTGFRPAFVLTKKSTSTSGWNLRDNKRSPENVVNEVLQADTSTVELTSGYDVDFLSNGFKLRTSLSDSNASGQTYIYLAIAEAPAKYSNAR